MRTNETPSRRKPIQSTAAQLICPHCLATWRPRPGRRETSGDLPISCPRCKRPLKMDPDKPCWCHDCMARREKENENV